MATVAVAVTPMVREATIDARAAALGAAVAIWLAIAFDETARRAPADRGWFRALLVASVLAAFVHPSTMFVGVVGLVSLLRRTRRPSFPEWARTARRELLAAAIVVVGGVAIATLQSGAAEAVATSEFGGIRMTLAQLPGGRALAGAALLLTCATLLAGLAFDHERPLRAFGGGALMWFAACLAALPVRNLFVPRYFVAAAVLVLATVIVAEIEAWNRVLVTSLLGIALFGSLERLDTQYGYGSGWCPLAHELADETGSGDRVVFASSVYASAIRACGGGDLSASIGDADALPAGIASATPRTLWTAGSIDPDRYYELILGARTHVVWIPGVDTAAGAAIDELMRHGAVCTTRSPDGIALTSCAAG
ncbi:MAG: hypothetical protein R2705_22365 [Ilumatobacteraceae bacterium]